MNTSHARLYKNEQFFSLPKYIEAAPDDSYNFCDIFER